MENLDRFPGPGRAHQRRRRADAGAGGLLLRHPAERQPARLLGPGGRPAVQDPQLHEHPGHRPPAPAVRAADRPGAARPGRRRRGSISTPCSSFVGAPGQPVPLPGAAPEGAGLHAGCAVARRAAALGGREDRRRQPGADPGLATRSPCSTPSPRSASCKSGTQSSPSRPPSSSARLPWRRSITTAAATTSTSGRAPRSPSAAFPPSPRPRLPSATRWPVASPSFPASRSGPPASAARRSPRPTR